MYWETGIQLNIGGEHKYSRVCVLESISKTYKFSPFHQDACLWHIKLV